MRRVLMISPHFPPDATAATHRVRLLAPHLLSFGWNPTVLAVDERDYEGTLDRELTALVPGSIEVRRARAWPVAATRHLGVGDLGLRALRGLAHESDRLLRARDYRAVFITTYPVYPALLGPRLKRRFRTPFVIDLQDPLVGSWGLSVGGGPGGGPDLKSRASRLIARTIESRALRAADAVTAVSAMTYEDALQRVKCPNAIVCETLPVGWDAGDLAGIETISNCCFNPHDGFSHLVYVGTVLPHGFDVLRALFAAMRMLAENEPATYARLRLHFIGTSNQTSGAAPARVMPIARDFGLSAIVNEWPLRVPYRQALKILADATAVLLLGSSEPHYTASKIYPAMLAQRPVLACFHRASNAVTVLRAVGGGSLMHVVDFDGPAPSSDAIYPHLAALTRGVRDVGDAIDLSLARPYSARSVAERLASVLDRIAS